MLIRSCARRDLPQLIALTIETFGPFYEDSFRPLVGERVFTNQHGDWQKNYRVEVPALHDPDQHRYIAVAELDATVIGYVAWNLDQVGRHGTLTHLAVSIEHRRHHTGSALCEHAFDQMRSLGIEVAVIGTGGDPFHAPARALYDSLECIPLPTVVYYRPL